MARRRRTVDVADPTDPRESKLQLSNLGYHSYLVSSTLLPQPRVPRVVLSLSVASAVPAVGSDRSISFRSLRAATIVRSNLAQVLL
jgi:hypothetical protein